MKKINSYFFKVILIALIATSCTEDDTETSGDFLEEIPVEKIEAFELYNASYLTSNIVSGETVWIDGNTTNCESGRMSETAKNKILQKILYFRKAVGLENTITINPDKSEKAQEAALMCKVNNDLNHNPPASWQCYSEDGRSAASKSNLAFFSNPATNAVNLYMSDDGNSNFAVGHRRWLLWPKLQDIGIGNTDRTNAIWVIGDAGSLPDNAPEFISWPPKGYVPSNLVYNRWSFSLANANFSNATVSMKNRQGSTVALSVEELAQGFGDNTIVWRPQNIDTNSADDLTYTVTISDVVISGETMNFEYEVILFDVDSINL